MNEIKLILSILLIINFIFDNNNNNNNVNAFKFTDRFCNFTLYPKHGCEEPEYTTCIDNKCACRDETNYILLGRFCTKKLCPNGEYYDQIKEQCIKQSKGSNDVTENHCRYDYHCFGTNIKCRQYGWNFNCVCDSGFSYDSITKLCLPTHGIGGHCKRDLDCDETSLRKMYCNFSIDNNEENDNNKSKIFSNFNDNNNNNNNNRKSGTCQCQDKHRYNYNIDGCEALSDIAEREHNMRTLVLLFVAAGLLFGLALTCNFSFFGIGPKTHEIYLHQLKAEERIRQMKQQQQRLSLKNENPPQQQQQQQQTSNETNINDNNIKLNHDQILNLSDDDDNIDDKKRIIV